MARQPRITLPGVPHHLQLRGHNRQPICHDEEDRRRLLSDLRDALREHQVPLHGYAVLPSSLHLLVTPARSDDVGRLLQSLSRRYVSAFNARHERSGALWEGRYRAHLVADDVSLLACLRLLELAAAEAGQPDASSLPHHLGQRRDPLVTDPPAYWALGNTPFDREAAYRQRVEQGVAPAERTAVEAALRSGRPWGTPAALQSLEKQLGRSLATRPRGRPRKA
jgi:putative transposase